MFVEVYVRPIRKYLNEVCSTVVRFFEVELSELKVNLKKKSVVVDGENTVNFAIGWGGIISVLLNRWGLSSISLVMLIQISHSIGSFV